jgi:hypothetical protein
MIVRQAPTTTTLSSSLDRKEAVGKNTKWSGKMPAPSLALLSYRRFRVTLRSRFSNRPVARAWR